MAKDPRSEFIRKSNMMACGITISDCAIDDENELAKIMDSADPRQAFISASQALANKTAMADLRKIISKSDDKDENIDPRERFIRDSQRLADGESRHSIMKNLSQDFVQKQNFRSDDQRSDYGGRLFSSGSSEEEDDPRAELLRKMAEMHKTRR